ncbi:PREDICTED: uncharacterized protein LOC105365900 [Ceratosolen solmsi marchali]|uniref:Uncharacterized protein LOC105365900 n=1 Tax=Ceratosolen solmsi marchali TaxID=326594 RepID=A0AAJ6YQR4_9HYME|nr:PREDICTED: uncharacterized protein LOC105365900 [Ceratosolen solmsi marchali]
MSMLAEPKRKQKWMLNSRGKQWSEDSNKFGQKIMEKMGWSNGKGLGAQEQGMVEHIRVKVKNDQVGVGYNKDRDNHWSEYQESFSRFLEDLQKEKSSDTAEIIKEKDDDLNGKSLDKTEPIEGKDIVLNRKSLEEKSKQSQKRVHYRKFVRGKDVNKYSPKDLANIFGKKNLNEKYIKEENEDNFDNKNEIYDPIGTKCSTHGIITIKAGNMNDYFKNKTVHAIESSYSNQKTEDILNDTQKNIEFGSSLKNKSKFYVNNAATSPINNDSESESERYTGFGFSKSKKVNNLNYVFDNPCLDLNILDDNSPIQQRIKSDINGIFSDKIIRNKRKNESSEKESLEYSNKFSTKKQRREFIYDNGGLDLEFPDNSMLSKEDTSESLLNKCDSTVSNMELSHDIKLNKCKKSNRKSLTNGNENEIILNTEFPDKVVQEQTQQSDSKSLSNGYDNFGLDLEFSNRLTPKKPKRNKNLSLLNGNKNDTTLNTECVDKSTLKESEQNNCEINIESLNKSTPKNINSITNKVILNGCENIGLDIKSPDISISKKIKKNRKFEDISNVYENPGLDLNCSDKISQKKKKIVKNLEILDQLTPINSKKWNKNMTLLIGTENPALNLDLVDTSLKEAKKSKKNKNLSVGIENPALDLELVDTSLKEAKKSKKTKNLSVGIENPALDLELVDTSLKEAKKSKKTKNLSVGIENPALDLELVDTSLKEAKKSKKTKNLSVGIENPALDLELVDTSLKEAKKSKKTKNLSVGIENPALDLELVDTSLKEAKKSKKTKNLSVGIENPALDLELVDTSLKEAKKSKKNKNLSVGIENSALDLEIVEIRKEVKKCKEIESFSNVFDNPALDLNDSANNIPITLDFGFEVSRIKNGMENGALDLSDENSNKKRVTFNAQVEYSSDTPKKKKKKKKLDKYEVANEKWKRIHKTVESMAFINEAIDEEITNIEEMDNELNERKSKKCKRKKERRISLLETIDETPEEENLDETPIIIGKSEKKDDYKEIEFKDKLNETMAEDFQEIPVEILLHKKKKKKKKILKETLNKLDESEEINVTEGQKEIMNTSVELTNQIKQRKKQIVLQ